MPTDHQRAAYRFTTWIEFLEENAEDALDLFEMGRRVELAARLEEVARVLTVEARKFLARTRSQGTPKECPTCFQPWPNKETTDMSDPTTDSLDKKNNAATAEDDNRANAAARELAERFAIRSPSDGPDPEMIKMLGSIFQQQLNKDSELGPMEQLLERALDGAGADLPAGEAPTFAGVVWLRSGQNVEVLEGAIKRGPLPRTYILGAATKVPNHMMEIAFLGSDLVRFATPRQGSQLVQAVRSPIITIPH